DDRGRLTQALAPLDPVTGIRPETDLDFSVLRQIKHSKKQDANNHWIVNYVNVDGVGRTTQTRSVDPAGDDFVDTTYDAAGRVSTVSNPHRSTSSPTDGIITSTYDGLGRATRIVKQDNSTSTIQYDQTSAISANGNCTFATDEAGAPRKTCSDGLGRLIEVDEPGGESPGSAASGTLTIIGTLQSKAATPGSPATGSVTIGGSEQSKSGVGAHPGTAGSGAVAISGYALCSADGSVCDMGQVWITVNGFSETTLYSGGSPCCASFIDSQLVAQSQA